MIGREDRRQANFGVQLCHTLVFSNLCCLLMLQGFLRVDKQHKEANHHDMLVGLT